MDLEEVRTYIQKLRLEVAAAQGRERAYANTIAYILDIYHGGTLTISSDVYNAWEAEHEECGLHLEPTPGGEGMVMRVMAREDVQVIRTLAEMPEGRPS